MKGFLASAGVALVVSLAALAAADDPKPPFEAPKKVEEPEWKLKQRRQVIFDEGQKLLDQGKPREALEKFLEVYNLRAHPRVLLYIADAEEQSGHLTQAKNIYTQAQKDGHDLKLADVEQDATKALEALALKIPRIIVHVTPPVHFHVTLDLVKVVLQDGRVETSPGKHTLVVSAPDRKPYSEDIELKVGEQKVVEASLVPLPSAPFDPRPPPVAPGGCGGCAKGSDDPYGAAPGVGLAVVAMSFVRRRRRR